MHTVGSKGNSARNSGNMQTSCYTLVQGLSSLVPRPRAPPGEKREQVGSGDETMVCGSLAGQTLTARERVWPARVGLWMVQRRQMEALSRGKL